MPVSPSISTGSGERASTVTAGAAARPWRRAAPQNTGPSCARLVRRAPAVISGGQAAAVHRPRSRKSRPADRPGGRRRDSEAVVRAASRRAAGGSRGAGRSRMSSPAVRRSPSSRAARALLASVRQVRLVLGQQPLLGSSESAGRGTTRSEQRARAAQRPRRPPRSRGRTRAGSRGRAPRTPDGDPAIATRRRVRAGGSWRWHISTVWSRSSMTRSQGIQGFLSKGKEQPKHKKRAVEHQRPSESRCAARPPPGPGRRRGIQGARAGPRSPASAVRRRGRGGGFPSSSTRLATSSLGAGAPPRSRRSGRPEQPLHQVVLHA